MSRKLGHPAPTDLSRLRAGVHGGRQGRRLAAHIARCPGCARVYAQLDAVSVTLREAPRALLPAPVERRILVAMAAEAARRQVGHPGGTRHGRRRPSVPFPRSLPVMVAPAIAGALLVFAGFGYLLSSIRTSPPSPIPAAAPPASATTGPALPGIGVSDGPSGTGGSPVPPGWVTVTTASGVSHTNACMVTDSNITYQKATLRAQVRPTFTVKTSAPAVQQVPPTA